MADGGGAQQFQFNAFDDYKRRLVGQRVGTDPNNKRPNLTFKMRNNLPQIVVKTGVGNDKDHGRISASFPTIDDFEAVLIVLEEIIQGPNNVKEAVQIHAKKFIQGKMSDPMPDTNVLMGKDENGVVWIGVTSWEKERPVIKFPFVPDDLMRYKHGDGRAWEPGELSIVSAKAMLRRVRAMFPFSYVNEYTQPKPRDNNQSGGGNRGYNGGGGGNNNNSNNSGGGGQRYGDDDGFPM